jgi:opacity protein-like surface antigen
MAMQHHSTATEMGQPRTFAHPRALATLCLLFGIALTTTPAHAQRAGDGFFFRPPPATLTLHGGLALASASSDIFDFSINELTLSRSDFHSPELGLDLAIRLTRRADLVLGVGYASTTRTSEFRDWVDQDDLPIEQKTSYRRLPLTASLKYYLTPRGRSIGRYAWIPGSWAPYLGAGGGLVRYGFSQRGDFVDFNSLDIFQYRFSSTGWAPTIHALAGVEYSLNYRWALTAEGRYSRASSELSDAFRGFDKIDLSGFTTTIGIQLRF